MQTGELKIIPEQNTERLLYARKLVASKADEVD